MDAVILAGGSVPEALRAIVPDTERALIDIAGQSSLARVVDSLRGVGEVERIIAVTTPQALASLDEDTEGLPAGDKLTANLLAGARAARSAQILVVTGDIPLASRATWEEFLAGARQRNLQAAFPILRREVCQRTFPGGRRTFATLREGTFTGGNAFLLPRDRLDSLQGLIESAFSARKNPLKLAGMLGLSFIFRALTKRLSVGEVEAKMSALLDCRGGAVEMQDATIAFDIDKPDDLEAARRYLDSPLHSPL